MQLKDQAAIVTGGASGLGAATARKLAAQGAKVAVFDLNAKLAESIAAELKGVAVACDVSDAASAEAAIAQAAKAHGPARVLVNCAGIGVAKRVVGRDAPHPLADFERVIKINLIGSFNMLRLAAMQSNKGVTAVAHNGNLVNATEIRGKLEAQGSIFQTNSDTEVIVHLIALSKEHTLPEAIADALRRVEGAFSLVMMSTDRIFRCP